MAESWIETDLNLHLTAEFKGCSIALGTDLGSKVWLWIRSWFPICQHQVTCIDKVKGVLMQSWLFMQSINSILKPVMRLCSPNIGHMINKSSLFASSPTSKPAGPTVKKEGRSFFKRETKIWNSWLQGSAYHWLPKRMLHFITRSMQSTLSILMLYICDCRTIFQLISWCEI